MRAYLLLFYLFNFSSLFAQSGRMSPENEKLFANDIFGKEDFIFEGTVLNTNIFYDNSRGCLASHLVQIHKVFKGNLKPGTVEVITDGYGCEIYDSATGQMSFPTKTHGYYLGADVVLFVANELSNVNFPHIKKDNNLVLSTGILFKYYLKYDQMTDSISVEYCNNFYNRCLDFKTFDDFYNFLTEKCNLKIIAQDDKIFKKAEKSIRQKSKQNHISPDYEENKRIIEKEIKKPINNGN